MQGAVAAALCWWRGLAVWWRLISFAFAPALYLGLSSELPPAPFLGVCRRHNVDFDELIDFGDVAWERKLRARMRDHGEAGLWSQIDGFVFHRHSPLVKMEPFAVGRPGWDNWFIWNARRQNIPVIDLSPITELIHQNHGYGHVKSGIGRAWDGAEADSNYRVMGSTDRRYTFVIRGNGSVTISTSATDNRGVTSMSILIDGVTVQTCTTSGSCSYAWAARRTWKN